MPPEVMLRENYSTGADYFQIGVVCHEIMKKAKPWNSNTRNEYKQDLITRQSALKKAHTPENWDHMASDFVNKCIKRKLPQRLGLNGPSELKNHIWFRDFEWKNLTQRKMVAPFVPPSGDNFNRSELLQQVAKLQEETRSKSFQMFNQVRDDDSF